MYASPVTGSTTSQVRDSVGTCRQGSTNALAGSGTNSMSLSLIAWKPRIEEPSKPIPSANTLSVSSLSGIEKCCHVPGRSQNFTSTICTPASLARRITSAGAGAVLVAFGVAAGSNVAVIRGVSLRVRVGSDRSRQMGGGCGLVTVRDSSHAGRYPGHAQVSSKFCTGCKKIPWPSQDQRKKCGSDVENVQLV